MTLNTAWGGYDMQAIDKHLIRLIFISFFLFSLLPRIGQNVAYVGVSEGCLEGVWEVSEGCLSDSGYCLGGYNLHAIEKHAIDSYSLVYSFSASFLGLVKMWGCL